MTATKKRQGTKGSSGRLEKNRLEWAVFALSLLLLMGMVIYLIADAAHAGPGSPDLRLGYTKDPSPHNPNRYLVTIDNSGDETAEDLVIEARLNKPGASPELSELQVAFAPKKSTRQGWVVFSGAPMPTDSLTLRVVSYKKP